MTVSQAIEAELIQLRAIKRLHANLQTLAQSATMQADILGEVHAIFGTSHILYLAYNPNDASLEYSLALPKPKGKPSVFLATFNAEEGSITKRLASGECMAFDNPLGEERLISLAAFMTARCGLLLPLKQGEKLIGMIAAYNSGETPLPADALALAQAISPSLVGLF
jgi:GAF domain-containing protein